MSLLFNMLSRFVRAFLPRSKHLLFHGCSHHLQWFWNQENKVCHCFHCLPIYLSWSDGTGCHDLSFLIVENEAGQRVIVFCQENALVIANTLFQQHKRQLYTQTSPDGQYQNQIDYNLCSQRWRSSIQSAKTRSGADCISDHELLIAKFRLKLKKEWKPPDHSGMT